MAPTLLGVLTLVLFTAANFAIVSLGLRPRALRKEFQLVYDIAAKAIAVVSGDIRCDGTYIAVSKANLDALARAVDAWRNGGAP